MNSKSFKTRDQIAAEFGISRKTLYNWLQRKGILLPRLLISIQQQEAIYELLGNPHAVSSTKL